MQNVDTRSTIAILKRLFSQHGLLEIFVSNNGSPFMLHHFCSSCCITRVRSPSYHPQSNGQAERFVYTFKRALLKAKGKGTTTEDIINTFPLFQPNNNKWYSEKWNVSIRSSYGTKAPVHIGCYTPTKTNKQTTNTRRIPK